MNATLLRLLRTAASLLAAPAAVAAQLSVTPSYPAYGESISVELRDTQWPSYLQATRYTRNGWNISVEYEHAAEAHVAGRPDFGNAVLPLGELTPGSYTIEARVFKTGDPSVAAVVVSQSLVVTPPRAWDIYLVPREPRAFVPTEVLIRSAVYFEPGSMQVTVNGNVVRVDFDYRGDAPVGGPMPRGTVSFAAARMPALGPGSYVVEGWGRDTTNEIVGHYFTRQFHVSATVPVVEYYSESLDQYVLRASSGDIATLDAHGPGDWKRTGQQFSAWLRMGDGPAEAQPVCSFRVDGSESRFYTGLGAECADLKGLEARQRAESDALGMQFRGWAYESIAFYALMPEKGQCAGGTTPVFRSYNRAAGQDANHRFTTDVRQHVAMAMSWADEGAAFCSPPG